MIDEDLDDFFDADELADTVDYTVKDGAPVSIVGIWSMPRVLRDLGPLSVGSDEISFQVPATNCPNIGQGDTFAHPSHGSYRYATHILDETGKVMTIELKS